MSEEEYEKFVKECEEEWKEREIRALFAINYLISFYT